LLNTLWKSALKMPFSLLKGFTPIRWLVPGLGAIALAGTASYYLIDFGEKRIQAKWDADKLAHIAETETLKNEIKIRESEHRAEVRGINTQLAEAARRHSSELTALRIGFSERLRESEGRAEVYQSLANSGSAQRTNLASYAAQLDRSVVEGRQVVGELRATIIQRDEQIRALGRQITADRELISEKNQSIED